MRFLVLICSISLALSEDIGFQRLTNEATGVLVLDKYTFNKVVDGHRSVFVQIIAVAWQKTPDISLAAKYFEHEELLMASLDVSMNTVEFEKRFGLEYEDMPAGLLFRKGSDVRKPIVYVV